jgi:phage FluMu protein Com
MAIEFRCTQCGKLLRTADDTAGKQAKCPECGAIMTIPEIAASGDNPFGTTGPQMPFPGESGNPFQSPGGLTPSGPNAYRAPIARGTLDIGDIFGRTWTLLKADFGMCLAAALIVLMINIGASSLSHLVPVVGLIVAMLFQVWIYIGQALFFLKKARGQRPDIGVVFNGWPHFGKILLASIIVFLILIGIAIVCVVPAALIGLAISSDAALFLGIAGGVVAIGAILYVQLMLSQFYYLIIDQDADVIDSLKMSNELMEGNKLTLFLINLVAGTLGTLLVLVTCGIGLVLVTPYMAMLNAVVYLTVTSQPTAEQMQSGPTA